MDQDELALALVVIGFFVAAWPVWWLLMVLLGKLILAGVATLGIVSMLGIGILALGLLLVATS